MRTVIFFFPLKLGGKNQNQTRRGDTVCDPGPRRACLTAKLNLASLPSRVEREKTRT